VRVPQAAPAGDVQPQTLLKTATDLLRIFRSNHLLTGKSLKLVEAALHYCHARFYRLAIAGETGKRGALSEPLSKV
jgi:hypothetical protein